VTGTGAPSSIRLAAAAVSLALLTAWAVVAQAGSARPAPGAKENLGGLTLWATLPYAHYGPGREITIYLTFVNRGDRTVVFRRAPGLSATFTLAGGSWTLLPLPGPGPQAGPEADRVVRLAPGETWRTTLTVKPDRKEMLQGIYTLRVRCALGEPPAEAVGQGRGIPVSGLLLSNEVEVRIKYDVMIVY
jgi:hypothetical protein